MSSSLASVVGGSVEVVSVIEAASASPASDQVASACSHAAAISVSSSLMVGLALAAVFQTISNRPSSRGLMP